eukprot:PITA_03911
MCLTVHLSLLVAPALLLLCSATSCLGSQYQNCQEDLFKCGIFNFSYPFGKKGSGCGDPDFQLDCPDDTYHPLLNINGEEYRIWELRSLDNSIIIVNDNLFGGKCNLSGNYSQFWWPGSHFQIGQEYSNLMLCGQRDQSIEETPQLRHLSLCHNDLYYNISTPEVRTGFCKTHFELPIHEEDLIIFSKFDFNPYFPWYGFEVILHVDPIRSQSCGDCLKSEGTCGYKNSEPTTFLCYCPDDTSRPDKCPTLHGRKNRSAIVIGCSVGGAALTAIAFVLFLTYYVKGRKPSPSKGHAMDSSKNERKDMEAYVPRLKIGNLSIFSYEELRQATNCFHEENELGDGGFGSVYLGKLRDGLIVAVKRLYQDGSRTLAQFINEVAIFSCLNHPHLVRLYGCTSADSPELLLVYEFVPNGTLENHLHGDRNEPGGLSWNTRLNIAIQTAHALAFLHSFNPPIFHRDVKSSNILLDENFNVKVADFGLCRYMPVSASHVTTTPQGTPGSVDPEYHKYYQLTEKSDVYSFGVVLVEIISAKLAVDVNRDTREINLANLAISKIQHGALHELVDPQLEMETNEEVKVTVSAVAELAFRCLASESDDRPHMKEVVAQLEVIRGMLDVCPSPQEQSASFLTHKHWRSFPTSVQEKWPITGYNANASA